MNVRMIYVWLSALGVVIGLAACGESAGGDENLGGDASGRLACVHFSNVAKDVVDGVLTPTELRDKIREVEDDASLSDAPGLATHSRAMLAAATAGDNAALDAAVRSFGDACRDIGVLR